MAGFITIIQVILAGAGMLALVRAIQGPTLADRIVAVDLVLLLLAGGVAAHAARSGSELLVPVLVVVALVAFASTVLVARFIEWRDGP
ncbi:MAG: monovalent cation/H+ antiporter complex subunit F [Acidimicrobiia bacterium]|nr:monovalent cation/H+ antiporter complex subunit F [Acidimicrobiia bacterium]